MGSTELAYSLYEPQAIRRISRSEHQSIIQIHQEHADMRAGHLSEKVSFTRRRHDSDRTGLRALFVFMHLLLWSSAYVLASEVYMLVTGVVAADLLPTAIVLVASVISPPV